MNPLLVVLAFAVTAEPQGLTTSYIHQLRADIALADHIAVRVSRENGGATRTIGDLSELREIANHIPRTAAVEPLDGAVGTNSYVTLSVFASADSKQPAHELTVIQSQCMFRVGKRLYRFKTSDDSLFKAAFRAAARDQ